MKNSKTTSRRQDESNIALVTEAKAPVNNADDQWARELQRTDLDRKRIENAGVAQDIKERRNFATKAFALVAVWILLVYILLIFQGFPVFHFRLPEHVILAAICSTTVTLVGILTIVIKYLFPTKK